MQQLPIWEELYDSGNNGLHMSPLTCDSSDTSVDRVQGYRTRHNRIRVRRSSVLANCRGHTPTLLEQSHSLRQWYLLLPLSKLSEVLDV